VAFQGIFAFLCRHAFLQIEQAIPFSHSLPHTDCAQCGVQGGIPSGFSLLQLMQLIRYTSARNIVSICTDTNRNGFLRDWVHSSQIFAVVKATCAGMPAADYRIVKFNKVLRGNGVTLHAATSNRQDDSVPFRTRNVHDCFSITLLEQTRIRQNYAWQKSRDQVHHDVVKEMHCPHQRNPREPNTHAVAVHVSKLAAVQWPPPGAFQE